MTRRGEMGISSLLIMIATIAVVSIFLFVYLATTNKLEAQSYQNAEKTEKYVSTKVIPSELRSEYENRMLQKFSAVVKPGPGSESLYIDSMTITLSTDDEKTTLKHAGPSAEINHSFDGYFTLGQETYDVPSTLEDDIDLDQAQDILSIDANGNAILTLSTGGAVTLGNCSDNTTFDAEILTSAYVDSVSGSCEAGVVTNVTLTPSHIGEGFFTVEYMIQSSNHLAGRLDRGEVIRIYFESQNKIGNDEDGTLNFILKSGSETELRFHTPDVERTGAISLSHY